MITIDISATVRSRIDKPLLAQAARAALLGRVQLAVVSVAVVGAARMRRMNREALGHDYVTDVLSFDHGDSPEGHLFEVVVCAAHAAQQARRYGVPLRQELARYVVHGCLHCAGFDDVTSDEADRMWRVQEGVLLEMFGNAYNPGGLTSLPATSKPEA